ncbi:MAG: hypothetical protein M3044_14545 [Thermoproteota archaeon]|nr:hypothetical protein [Thermoproteota archaeon]
MPLQPAGQHSGADTILARCTQVVGDEDAAAPLEEGGAAAPLNDQGAAAPLDQDGLLNGY